MYASSDILYNALRLQGLRAIYSPHTGIADYGAVTNCLVKLFKDSGGEAYTNYEVSGFEKISGDEPMAVAIKAKNCVSISNLISNYTPK